MSLLSSFDSSMSLVPQPPNHIFVWELDRVCGRAQPNIPSQARGAAHMYRCKHLDRNNISNIADFKKTKWPNISVLFLGKTMLTKRIINSMNFRSCPSFLQSEKLLLISTMFRRSNVAI